MTIKKSILISVAGLLALFAGFASANEPFTHGDYTVYYNAFNADTLQPKIAETYNIVRSKNRGVLSISVIKKGLSPAPMGTPVHADISVSASNLTGQLRNIDIEEIDEGTAIYYISEFTVAHEEILDFALQIKPEGEDSPFVVKFRQQFYTD